MLKINSTPVRTSRNFKINNIQIDEKNLPEKIGKFENIIIQNESKNIIIENKDKSDFKLSYGMGDILTNEVKNNANQRLKVIVKSKTNQNVSISFKQDKENKNLVDNIQIILNENTKSNITIKYESDETTKTYHNGIINVIAKAGATSNITIVNLLNKESSDFLTLQNNMEKNSKLNYCIIDLGGKNTITNYYSNIIGDMAENNLESIYLGKNEDVIDLNYIVELRGKKSKVNLDIQGALKDKAKKNFKGTIDFKTGAKKAVGSEQEDCMLLSDTAKAIALPMLLCSEEDVEGSHATSAGKIGEKELFYIMSRGFNIKEAMKLMVKAKFNKILENIKDEVLKEQILNEIDNRLE